MRGKRGDGSQSSLFFAIFEVLLIAIFIAAVFGMINKALSDQTYYQRYLARDLALTLDSMHAAPGDFELYYSYATPKPTSLDIGIKPGSVTISPAAQRNETDAGSKFLV